MTNTIEQLQWSEDQWNRVRQVVYEEARRARVAGSVLPLFGPLDADATYARKEVLIPPGTRQTETGEVVNGFSVKDDESIKLVTLQTKVWLRGAQVADPELASALIAFRRAANVLARAEDIIIFHGQQSTNEGPAPDPAPPGISPLEPPSLWQLSGGQNSPGLVGAARERGGAKGAPGPGAKIRDGNALVAAVSDAISSLERDFHLGPFACILDQKYFTIAQTPDPGSMVLPQDRILPFLGGGSLLRSSVLADNSGLVIALGGAPIDLVVATDISVNFLQVTLDPWHVFRVHEKIALRLTQPDAVIALTPLAESRGKGKG